MSAVLFLIKAIMDDRDERLRQLIAAVCQHPNGCREWRKAMQITLSKTQTTNYETVILVNIPQATVKY